MAGQLRPGANGVYQFPGSLAYASPLQRFAASDPASRGVNFDFLSAKLAAESPPATNAQFSSVPGWSQFAQQGVGQQPAQLAPRGLAVLPSPGPARAPAQGGAAAAPSPLAQRIAEIQSQSRAAGALADRIRGLTQQRVSPLESILTGVVTPASMTPNPYADGNTLYGFNQSAPLADREFAARERMVSDRAPWQPYDDPESRARARAYGGGPELLSEAVRRQRQEELAARIVSDFGGQGAQSPQDMLAALLKDPSVQMNGDNPELTYSGGRLQDTPWYDEYVALSNLNRALPPDQQIDLPAIHNTGTFVQDPAMLQRQQEVSDRRDAERAARRENVVLNAQARRWGIHPAILSQLQQEQQQQELVNGLMERLLGGQGGQPGQPGAPGLGSGGGGIGDLIAAQALGIDPSAMVAQQQLQWDQTQAGDAAQQRAQAMQVFQNPNATAAERLAAAGMLGIETDAALAGIQQPFSPEQIAAQRDALVPTIESALPQGTPSATDITGVGPRVAYIQRINPGMSYEQALAQFYILYPNAPRQSGDPFDTSPQRQEPGSPNPYGIPTFMFGM